MPSEAGDAGAPEEHPADQPDGHGPEPVPKAKDFVEDSTDPNGANNGANAKDQDKRKPARGPEPFDQSERDEMERLLEEVRGHLGKRGIIQFCRKELLTTAYLVLYPTRFLEGEDHSNNFLFNADRLVYFHPTLASCCQ